ncbi:hypothetical protein JGH11_19465, partial [Dysgonomonas sp. Marseille-P4677]|nr:hypothetical protein [Dysgonomonas sp. Marseille-P4677]
TLDYTKCRLILNSFNISDKDSKGKLQYKFSYIEGSLPSKQSFNTDIWGYYNGSNNFAKIPTYSNLKFKSSSINKGNYPEAYISYIDSYLLPDTEFMKYGTLNEIEYPTGGKTKFIFEPHEFYNKFRCSFTAKDNLYVTYSPDDISQQNSPYTDSRDFTLDEDGYVVISYHYHPHSSLIPIEPSVGYVTLMEKQGNQYYTILEKLVNLDQQSIGTQVFNDCAVYLKKGTTYKIQLWRETKNESGQSKYFNYYVTATTKVYTPYTFDSGGGLRIKEIQNIIDNKIVKKKQYSYISGGKSTGTLLSMPDFSYLLLLDKALIDNSYQYSLLTTLELFLMVGGNSSILWGSPIIQINSSQLNIGYNSVIEINLDENNNTIGRSEYQYLVEPLKDKIPFPTPKQYHIGNGTLLMESQYDQDNNLINLKKWEYSFKNIQGASSRYILKLNRPTDDAACSGGRFYKITPQWWSLDRIYESEYPTVGGYGVYSQKEYKYNNTNRLVNRITEFLPTIMIETNTNYASEYSGLIFEKMISKNMIGIPIEIVIQRDGKVTKANKFEFNNNLYLNRSFSAIGTSLTMNNYIQYYEKDYEIEKFDSYGNPVYILKDDAIHLIYLWSYGGQYPIAEIKNATYTDINSALSTVGLVSIDALSANTNPDKAKLDKLRTLPILNNALINTYKYQPLVGLLESTDPTGITTFYDYDDFSRLKETYIKDSNGTKQVIQKHDYHYQNQ